MDKAERFAFIIQDVWRHATKSRWDQIRGWCHGAGLVAAYDDVETSSQFYLLRDIAAQHYKDAEK